MELVVGGARQQVAAAGGGVGVDEARAEVEAAGVDRAPRGRPGGIVAHVDDALAPHAHGDAPRLDGDAVEDGCVSDQEVEHPSAAARSASNRRNRR